MDILLEEAFEPDRWAYAIQKGVEKGMDYSSLRKMSDPMERIRLYREIKAGRHIIGAPHEALIPKDDGTFRTVYVNEDVDRLLLGIMNDLYFEHCASDMIHPSCKSYLKETGCSKVVQDIVKIMPEIKNDDIGCKIDLTKYFDSVAIEYIDEVFDEVDKICGPSKMTEMVRRYYHQDDVIDINGNLIQKYQSLKQGCAVAAFLADAMLKHVDKSVSKLVKFYVRYSDDILLLGDGWENGLEVLRILLGDMKLTLNPKKLEYLSKNRWFKFLGFNIKGTTVSLSKKRVKTFQKNVLERTIYSHKKDPIKEVNHWLYVGDGKHSWASSVLNVLSSEEDINTLNSYVMDAIRASMTGKHKIGGLGVDCTKENGCIVRGKGANVKTNREKIPHIQRYKTIQCLQKSIKISKCVYNTIVASM